MLCKNKNLSNHQFPLQLSRAGAIDIDKDEIGGCILQIKEIYDVKLKC
jgi:hypothetical protein